MSTKPTKSLFQPISTCVADVERKAVQWLWSKRIPVGTETTIAGDPGVAKTLMMLDIAARVSRGKPLPFSREKQPAADIVIVSAEDDLETVIAPRLHAAGADLKRIHSLDAVKVPGSGCDDEFAFALDTTLGALEVMLDQHPSTRLVIIDPVTAFLAKADANSNTDVRAMMRSLGKLAAAQSVAVVLISHLNKKVADFGSALYRVTGSLGFVAAARAAFLVAEDPDGHDCRLMLPLKMNLAKRPKGLAFYICENGDGVPYVAWNPEPVHLTADDVVRAGGGRGPSETQRAKTFLERTLAEGPMAADEVKKRAEAAGFAWRTVNRAKADLHVESERDRNDSGQVGDSCWWLPGTPRREFGKQANRANDPEKPVCQVANSPTHDGQCQKPAGESR
ncbi:MAG: AAA family ATPase [Planctomycetes bacterium]|nr:AAA family ATPase [Planctomycetota bacterium]